MMENEKHDLTRWFYDRISHAYDLIADAGEHKAREKGREILAIRQGERVLEIGYGTGRSLVELAKAAGPDGHVSVVSMATTPEGEKDALLERTYKWFHQHFPHIVDCQPIHVTKCVRDAGFVDVNETRMAIWTLPVAIVLAMKKS